jgi:hypothetical protein
MNMKITPQRPGGGGIACMPLKRNIPDAPYPDWKLAECPLCGAECWESDLLRQVVKLEGCAVACTECALRAGEDRND